MDTRRRSFSSIRLLVPLSVASIFRGKICWAKIGREIVAPTRQRRVTSFFVPLLLKNSRFGGWARLKGGDKLSHFGFICSKEKTLPDRGRLRKSSWKKEEKFSKGTG